MDTIATLEEHSSTVQTTMVLPSSMPSAGALTIGSMGEKGLRVS